MNTQDVEKSVVPSSAQVRRPLASAHLTPGVKRTLSPAAEAFSEGMPVASSLPLDAKLMRACDSVRERLRLDAE